MAYQAIARKWRPKNFAELVGQDHISQTLLNALRNDQLHPVLLFTGPRGTGKTSTARILAKSIRCPNAKDFVPCGECSSCIEVSEGRSLDVMEIDGASNNGVDAVRELRESVGFMPTSGKYKVYIIDEVHMLSGSAFNALLKTMEEPPAHVVFILATTEVHKIPATILSRCLKFDFRRIPLRQIADQLVKIANAEGFGLQADAAWLLAKQADGSMRDSQSLLDQVRNYAKGEIDIAILTEVLALTNRTLLTQTLKAILTRDRSAIAQVIEQIYQAACDPRVFAQDFLEQIRNTLLIRVSGERCKNVVDLPDNEIQELRELSQTLSEEDLQFLFDITLKGIQDLLRAQESRLVLEMLLLKLAAAPRIVDLQTLLSHAPTGGNQHVATSVSRGGTIAHTTSGSGHGQVSGGHGGLPNYAAASYAMPNLPEAPMPTTPPKVAPTQAVIPPVSGGDPWSDFVHNVRASNGLLGAMLENAHLVEQTSEKLVVGVPKKLQLIFDKLREADNIKRLEGFVSTFLNQKLKVEVRQNEEGGAKVSLKTNTEKAAQNEKKSIEKTSENHPWVRSAQEAFGSQIKAIKERT